MLPDPGMMTLKLLLAPAKVGAAPLELSVCTATTFEFSLMNALTSSWNTSTLLASSVSLLPIETGETPIIGGASSGAIGLSAEA